MVVLATFPNQETAALVAARLETAGIEHLIKSDDCGGMLPPAVSASGVVLLVKAGDAGRARDMMDKGELAPHEAEPTVDAQAMTAPLHRVRRKRSFVSFVMGILFGALGYWAVQDYVRVRDHVVDYDMDGDGRTDEQHVWRKGYVVEMKADRNRDGVFDSWNYYQSGRSARYEEDNNFDGKPDSWSYCSNEREDVLQQDTDFNGIVDDTFLYTNSVLFLIEMRPNKSSNITIRTHLENGVLREEFRDVDGDGFFDLSVQYDPFYVPIKTNHIKEPYKPTETKIPAVIQ